MPFVFSNHQLPSGATYLRIDASGRVELADGEAYADQLLRPEHRNGLALSVIAAGTEYSPEIRKFFPRTKELIGSLAVVVTSPIVRAAIGLMVRLTPMGDMMGMFGDEASALAWLEKQAALRA